MISFSDRYKLRPEKKGGFLYDRETHDVYVVNETALHIIDIITKKCKIEEIVQYLKKQYPNEVEKSQEEEVIAFVDSAVKKGFFIEHQESETATKALGV